MSDSASDASVRSRFSLFQAEDFNDWLVRGFVAYYGRKARQDRTVQLAHPPFDFAHHLIGIRESIIHDLAWIYDRLIPTPQQRLFRIALGDVLRQRIIDPLFPVDGISDLLYLIPAVKAYESVGAIAPAVSREGIATEKAWLQYEAIAAYKTLMPSREALQGLLQLTTLPHFNNAYSFDVLTELCRHDPEHWASAVWSMSGYIRELHEIAERMGHKSLVEFQEAVRRFSDSLVHAVPLHAIAAQIHQLLPSTDGDDPYGSGAWLLEALFDTNRPLLQEFDDRADFDETSDSISVPVGIVADSTRRAHINLDLQQYVVLTKATRGLCLTGTFGFHSTEASAESEISEELRRKLSLWASKIPAW